MGPRPRVFNPCGALPGQKGRRLPESQPFGQLWRREGIQHCGRKDSVCLFLPLGSPVGALRRQSRYLLHGLQWRSGGRRSELPECHGNLEWACIVRDQKELWKVGLYRVSDLPSLRLGMQAVGECED